jgi:hypothetical protein
MIVRHWRGWTGAQDAHHYEKLLQKKVLPSLKTTEGYRGGQVLRSDDLEGAVRRIEFL